MPIPSYYERMTTNHPPEDNEMPQYWDELTTAVDELLECPGCGDLVERAGLCTECEFAESDRRQLEQIRRGERVT